MLRCVADAGSLLHSTVSKTSGVTPYTLFESQADNMLHGPQGVKVKPVGCKIRRTIHANNVRNESHCSGVRAFESNETHLSKVNPRQS